MWSLLHPFPSFTQTIIFWRMLQPNEDRWDWQWPLMLNFFRKWNCWTMRHIFPFKRKLFNLVQISHLIFLLFWISENSGLLSVIKASCNLPNTNFLWQLWLSKPAINFLCNIVLSGCSHNTVGLSTVPPPTSATTFKNSLLSKCVNCLSVCHTEWYLSNDITWNTEQQLNHFHWKCTLILWLAGI